jgi:hypothetical protein
MLEQLAEALAELNEDQVLEIVHRELTSASSR